MKLLLIEDNLELSHWLARLLREQDFVVDEVADGAAADLQLRQARYDVVLLDLNIPQLSGKGVLRRLRERGDGVPVLILTASANWRVCSSYRRSPHSRVLARPGTWRRTSALMRATSSRPSMGLTM